MEYKECQYTKYSIIEIVPLELKSYKTPFITIFNSLALWIWLLIYGLYLSLSAFLSKKKSLKKLFKNKYKQTEPHKETTLSLSNNESIIEKIDKKIIFGSSNNNAPKFIESNSEVFKGKIAYKILETIINEIPEESLILENLNKEDVKKIGSIVLRKEIITAKVKDVDSIICNKVLLTRAISDPVNKYIDFIYSLFFISRSKK